MTMSIIMPYIGYSLLHADYGRIRITITLSSMRFEVTFFYTSYLIGFILHEYMQVLLTTPTTPNERMEKIAQASEGFIYLVSFSLCSYF